MWNTEKIVVGFSPMISPIFMLFIECKRLKLKILRVLRHFLKTIFSQDIFLKTMKATLR